MERTQRALTRGASLLEIVLVTTLVLIVLTAGGRFVVDTIAAQKVDATTQTIVAHLRSAQTLAVANAVDWAGVRISFGPTIRIAPLRRSDGALLAVVRESDAILPGVSVRPLGARPHVDFASSGAPTVGSNQTIAVESGNVRRYVVVAPVSGRARITTVRP